MGRPGNEAILREHQGSCNLLNTSSSETSSPEYPNYITITKGSLDPRPSHCPLFDRLQYCSTASNQRVNGGKAWERGYTMGTSNRHWLRAPFVMVMSHSAARCTLTIKYILKVVLPARHWPHQTPICLHADCCHLWSCFNTHKIVALKEVSGETTPKNDKSDLVTITWWSCRTNTSSWTNTHYSSIVCRFCTLPRTLLAIWELLVVWVVNRALSVVSLLQCGDVRG